MGLEDPIEAFQFAVKEFEASTGRKGVRFLYGLLSGIDKKNPETADRCIQIALKSDALKDQMANIYGAVNISVERINAIVQEVKGGIIPATACANFSYGKGLDNLSVEEIHPLIVELAFNHGSEGLWTSLEIILMYQHGKEKIDKKVVEWIKQITTSNQLLKKTRSTPTDGYLFEQLILLVQNHHGIDDDFAIDLSNQIVRLCQVGDYSIFSELDSNFKNIIKVLVKEKPILLWKTLSHFFEVSTPVEIYYLENIVSSLRHTSDEGSHSKEGSLFGIPDNECIEWAKVNPEIRTPFLCIFYPVIEIDEIGNSRWHPALEMLSYEFGTVQEFHAALQSRFYPSSWWGSLVPYLEKYLIPLETWFNHPVPEMSSWAKDIYYQLEREIDRERNRK